MKILRTDPDRFGIGARLLTLLLPAIVGLLALDSWSDQHSLKQLVQDAYDRPLLDSVIALQSSMSIAEDGSLQLNAPAVVQTMFNATNTEHRHLHVSLTPRSPSAPAAAAALAPAAAATPAAAAASAVAQTLLGEAGLPEPPDPTPGEPPATQAAGPALYNAMYQGHPVRVVALRRVMVDGHGQAFDLLVQAAEGRGPRDQVLEASSEQALLRDARMVLVLVLLVWLGVTWSLRPLNRLRRTVLESKGQALQRLDTQDVPHEVAPLVDAVNEHVARHRELLEQQQQFLADASHQLRTPLAIMMTQAGVALRETEPAQLRATLRAIVTQLTRSKRLSEQLLSLAHAHDSDPAEDVVSVVDLNTIAKDVVLQYLTLAHEKDQDLGWGGTLDGTHVEQEAVPVMASGPELHEVLSNLVHNAIAHTPRHGQITVTAGRQGDEAWVEVRDNGPGIALQRRAEVFDRFRQIHAEPGARARGAGLGLAIARAYARRNGGDVALADVAAQATQEPVACAAQPATGLRAILRLPLASGHQGLAPP
ncbi:sensor histidine kinase [soil metagenome]